MAVEAVYTNWFLGAGTTEGVRITFGESNGKDDEMVVAHQAIHMSVNTAIRLHNFLGAAIQALVQLKQQEIQAHLAKLMAANSPDSTVTN